MEFDITVYVKWKKGWNVIEFWIIEYFNKLKDILTIQNLTDVWWRLIQDILYPLSFCTLIVLVISSYWKVNIEVENEIQPE